MVYRVARYLERLGVLERDEENSYLQLDGIDEDPMQQLIGCSVSYRIAVGSQQVSLGDISKAFKQALTIGSEKVVARLGQVDGLNADLSAHIPLPTKLEKVRKT